MCDSCRFLRRSNNNFKWLMFVRFIKFFLFSFNSIEFNDFFFILLLFLPFNFIIYVPSPPSRALPQHKIYVKLNGFQIQKKVKFYFIFSIYFTWFFVCVILPSIIYFFILTPAPNTAPLLLCSLIVVLFTFSVVDIFMFLNIAVHSYVCETTRCSIWRPYNTLL